MPAVTPRRMTVRHVRRPVTRSTDLSSVPTMARFSTGNFWSERWSTAFCASSYFS